MVISICIPQYNRIKFLLKSLNNIEQQRYERIEIVISDDCSTDETEIEILKLKDYYKYPIVYSRNAVNLGYDSNLRKAITLATGDYVIIIGNDDSINPEYSLEKLIQFLKINQYPEIGFTNYINEESQDITKRARESKILGSGPLIALKYYSCFSFVGGIIFHRNTFLKYNTGKYDGSIFTQIYHAGIIIASGHALFSIVEPVIIKDVTSFEEHRISYLDVLPRKWSNYKKIDSGLPSVLNVILSALNDSNTLNQNLIYKAFRKIYFTTLPYWILDYKKRKALPAAIGLIQGMFPLSILNHEKLNRFNLFKICLIYGSTSVASLIFPVGIFERIKPALYDWVKQ